MMGEGQTKEGVKQFAEVFTPAQCVFFMLMQPDFINEGKPLRDLDQTIFDPCCGQGQFGCSEVVLKMFYNCLELPLKERKKAVLRILNSIYGMDIQAKSVDKARRHLLDTVCDAYGFFFGEQYDEFMAAAWIIQGRTIVGNSIEFMLEQVPPEECDKEWRNNIKDYAKKGHISKECADRLLNSQISLFEK